MTTCVGAVGPEPEEGPGEPETALWRAVLARAILDACGSVDALKEREGKEFERVRALSWFVRADEHFTVVCEFAELDPGVVRLRVLKLAEQFKPTVTKWGRLNRATLEAALGVRTQAVVGPILD